MEENDVLTILFEISCAEEKNGLRTYVYTPVEVVEGKELSGNNGTILQVPRLKRKVESRYLNQETNQFEFFSIGDPTSLDENYAYGFPIIVNEMDTEKKQKIKKDIFGTAKMLTDLQLFQTVSEATGFHKIFIHIEKFNYTVDPNNFNDLEETLKFCLAPEAPNTAEKKQKEATATKKTVSATPGIVIPEAVLNAREIYEEVSKTVICQDEQIKAIACALAKNSRLTSPSLKSNILVCGPTGVGKSEIFRAIHDRFKIPIAFEDSNEYTAASYKGKDVSEMLLHLIDNADGDVARAQRGILIVDEIDKKVSQTGEHETFTSAVINSFLKMMEGHEYTIEGPNHKQYKFDTSLLTFAFLGAFSGIEQYLPGGGRSLGFQTDHERLAVQDVKNIYTEETLHLFGLLPEFIGRCDTIIKMNKLELPDLVKIIKTSDKSQLLLYKELYESLGVKFLYSDATVRAIAQKADDLKLGARSIKKIVENALSVVNYDIFSNMPYTEIKITPKTIEDNKSFILR